MKITILNKNRINDTGSYELSNLLSFEIDEGFTITENFNKTLNSGTIRLSHLTSKIDIEPLDDVVLTDDERFNNIYFCVENYRCTEESLDVNNKTYTYEITLVSQIKKMEGLLLPNLSITPLRENKRSVWFYLRQFLDEYGEKIRYYRRLELTPEDYEEVFDLAYDFDPTIQQRYENIVCPELQWNEPTLREVIDDLLMVDNCIATLNNGVIGLIDLEETKEEIENYNYVVEEQNLNDYVSEIKMTMQNGLQNDIKNINNVVKTTEYLHLSTPDGYRITTDNFVFQTNYPILKIDSLYAKIPLTDTHGNTQIVSIDILNTLHLISEYQEHITKQTLFSYQQISWINARNYQNCCLYYNRGGNIITGFQQNYRKSWITNLTSYEIFMQVIGDYIQSNGIIDTRSDFITEISRIAPSLVLFEIEYETTATQTFSAGKSDIQNNFRQIKDNQTNSWVNINTQGKLEYSKANRLGNKGVLINQVYKNSGNLIKIKNTYKDNIIYETTYSIYKEAILVNAYAVKNYVLKDFFTGINSKIRTWVNAKDEAFRKDNLIKFYVELGSKKRNEYFYDKERLSFNPITPNYFYAPLKTNNSGTEVYSIPPLKSALVRFYSNNSVIPLQNQTSVYLLKELNSKVIGRSLVFSIALNSNSYETNIGNFGSVITYEPTTQTVLQPHTNMSADGGYTQPIIKYVDDNYEYDKITISYINGDKTMLWNTQNLTDSELTDMYKEISDMPIVADDFATADGVYPQFQNEWLRFSLEYKNRKDNKEMPSYSLQFEFCEESRDMYLTETFMLYQECISNISYKTNNKQVYIGDYVYGKTTIDLENDNLDPNATITISNDGQVNVNLSIEKGDKAIYIAINNKVLIGLKEITSFYLNILKYRNKNIYNNNKEKIGEI